MDRQQTSHQHGTFNRPMWGQYGQNYRQSWESRFSDKPWHQHDHAFRYGWESGFDDRFHGKDFTGASMDMEQGWHNRYSNWPDFGGNKIEGAWNDFKETVREGFETARREFNRNF